MKSTLTLLLAASLAATAGENSVTIWQTRVQQIQAGGAVDAPRLVEDAGTKPSLPIGENGSLFQLWGWKFVDGRIVSETLLDTTEVGTYLPEAEIRITTNDPFTQFKRSRVDQPFSVSFEVSGLLPSGAGVPGSARWVFVEHHADVYKAGTFDGELIESTHLVNQGYISQNGVITIPFASTNMPVADVARRAGRERFIVYALEDGNVPKRAIAEAVVQMYPVPEGSILGIDESRKLSQVPDFQVTAQRLYPGSSTWVEMYEGGYAAGKRGVKFPNTLELPSHVVPLDSAYMEFEDFTPKLHPSKNGSYTLVLRTSSPFPGESIEAGGMELDAKTIELGLTLRVNSMLTTME